jgi:hypothetical protein
MSKPPCFASASASRALKVSVGHRLSPVVLYTKASSFPPSSFIKNNRVADPGAQNFCALIVAG